MADINDIANEFIRDEIEEFIERDDERERIIGIFAQASEQMQNIAAALIDGDHLTVDELTGQAIAGAWRPSRSWTTG